MTIAVPVAIAAVIFPMCRAARAAVVSARFRARMVLPTVIQALSMAASRNLVKPTGQPAKPVFPVLTTVIATGTMAVKSTRWLTMPTVVPVLRTITMNVSRAKFAAVELVLHPAWPDRRFVTAAALRLAICTLKIVRHVRTITVIVTAIRSMAAKF